MLHPPTVTTGIRRKNHFRHILRRVGHKESLYGAHFPHYEVMIAQNKSKFKSKLPRPLAAGSDTLAQLSLKAKVPNSYPEV